MLGYFLVYPNPEEPFDIKCDLQKEAAINEVPNEQQELYNEIESTNSIIKSLHKTGNKSKTKYFNKLLSLSRAGLVGDTAQPKLALKSIEKLKEEIVLIEGQRIKNDYMKILGIYAALMCIGITLICLLTQLNATIKPLSMYFITSIGAIAGTWVSFGARKFKITFEQLSLLEEDMMNPCIRLIYIGVCSVIFLLFLNTGIVSIDIGGVTTEKIRNSIELQAAIGVLSGLVESKVGINIYKKAVKLFGEE